MAKLDDVSLNVIIGPLFVGIILNWFFLGILVIQIYNYFGSRYKDIVMVKSMVVILIILDILQTIFTTHTSWAFLVEGWGDPAVLASPPWSASTIPIMSSITASVVQFFFSWRILRLKNNTATRIIVAFIIMISLMQTIAAIIGSIKAALSGNLGSPSELFVYFTIWLVGSFVDDFIIATTMYFILALAVRETVSSVTESRVQRIMRQTVHTGAITAAAALVELVLFLHFRSNNLHDMPAFVLGKLYSNVMLATLNSRGTSSDTPHSSQSRSFPLSDFRARRARDADLTMQSSQSVSRKITQTELTTATYDANSEAELKYSTPKDNFAVDRSVII